MCVNKLNKLIHYIYESFPEGLDTLAISRISAFNLPEFDTGASR